MTAKAYDATAIIVVGDGATGEAAATYAGGHALVPVLIGLAAPAIVISVVDQQGLLRVSTMLPIYLAVLFVAAATVFILNVLIRGAVLSAEFDPKGSVARLTRTGFLAVRQEEIPLARIALAEVGTLYDRDGYPRDVARLILESGEVIALPADTTETDSAVINQMARRAKRRQTP